MHMPAYKSFSSFPETVKGWEAWQTQCAEWAAYREFCRKRRFHALPEDKGIPVPHTGYQRKFKYANGSGVSANSRILSHRYADEGEKGRNIRREVRRKERAQWLSEWQREQNEDAEYGYARDAYSAGEWFDDNPYMWDWYYGEDDYDSEDYYPRAWDDLWDYCDHCGGPCEL